MREPLDHLSRISRLLDEMKGRRLTSVCATLAVKSYRMATPEERSFSVLVTFTPEGIVLQGDITPTRYGTCSCTGYGLDWFVQPMEADYLAEKFLQTRYVHELAREAFLQDIREHNEDADGPDKIDEQLYMQRWDKELYEEDAEEAGELYRKAFGRYPEGWLWYDPHESAVLHAIQMKFAELYRLYQKDVAQTCLEGRRCHGRTV